MDDVKCECDPDEESRLGKRDLLLLLRKFGHNYFSRLGKRVKAEDLLPFRKFVFRMKECEIVDGRFIELELKL